MSHLTTSEVAKWSGATLRQLQVWAETGRLKAKRIKGNRRVFTEAEANKAKRLKMMSDAGLSHRRWDYLLKQYWEFPVGIHVPFVVQDMLIVPLHYNRNGRNL